MTTKLRLYKGACNVLGEMPLTSLTENRPLRYLLDDIYDNKIVRKCLEQGQWNFGIRSAEVSFDPDVTPDFGYSRAFSKPSDYVRTTAVCEDEWFKVPLIQYSDENNYIFCELETIYLSYISDDSGYGGDLSLWPESFSNFVEVFLAYKAAPTHVKDIKRRKEIREEYRFARLNARSQDAANQPTTFPAEGSWLRSRRGRSGNSDRGNISQLIG